MKMEYPETFKLWWKQIRHRLLQLDMDLLAAEMMNMEGFEGKALAVIWTLETWLGEL